MYVDIRERIENHHLAAPPQDIPNPGQDTHLRLAAQTAMKDPMG